MFSRSVLSVPRRGEQHIRLIAGVAALAIGVGALPVSGWNDQDGDVVWAHLFASMIPMDVAVRADGSVAVTGWSEDPGNFDVDDDEVVDVPSAVARPEVHERTPRSRATDRRRVLTLRRRSRR